MNDREEFQRQIDELLATDTGLDKWCWLRRRTSKFMEHDTPYLEEIGSSDVTCKLYQLWRDWRNYCFTGPAMPTKIDDRLGWYINGEIIDLLGLPRTRALEEYHNMERA
jgi:hypothetical protein